MSLPYSKPPARGSRDLRPFKIAIPEESLDELRLLLRLAKVAAPTYEASQSDRRYGVSREWILQAKSQWENSFDWREHEANINSFPQFILPINDVGMQYDIHFAALFSEKKDAIPLLLLHGWPGSFLEFLPLLSILRTKYTPQTLPYHVVVPSLSGYAFSTGPPIDRDFSLLDVAHRSNRLMQEMGFASGYVVQGGDVGSKVARILGVKYESCKAVHLNFCMMAKPEKDLEMDEAERDSLKRGDAFEKLGRAYALEHATRPSTISFVLASNPLGLLAWIGEKFLEWSDEDPPMGTILESVTLYWVTQTLSTSLFSYRARYTPENAGAHGSPQWYISKPLGYSWFPREIAPTPRSWVATTGNLVSFRKHSHGGHFASMERPKELLDDVEEFIQKVWR